MAVTTTTNTIPKWLIVTILIILGVIVLLWLMAQSAKAAEDKDDANERTLDELMAMPLSRKICRQKCRRLCKAKYRFGRNRRICKRNCKDDCRQGKEILPQNY